MCICICICICVCVCVYVCVYVYVYVYVYMYVYMCMCICVYMCMCVCKFRDLESGPSKTKCQVWKDGERTVRRAKSEGTLVEASRDTNAQIARYTCFMGANDKSNHNRSLTASSGKANDQRNREHVVLDLFSN